MDRTTQNYPESSNSPSQAADAGSDGAHAAQAAASRARIQPTAERLSQKAHEAVDKAHGTIDRVSETAVQTEQQLRENVAEAEAQLRAFQSKAQKAADEQLDQARSFIQEKPLQSAGIAFAAGLVLSRILR